MSLILEALKKSEANRRLGEVPDLATPFATQPRRRGPMPVLFVLIVATSVGGWWLLRAPSPDTQGAASSDSAAPARAPGQPAAAHTAPAAAANAPVPAAVASQAQAPAPEQAGGAFVAV